MMCILSILYCTSLSRPASNREIKKNKQNEKYKLAPPPKSSSTAAAPLHSPLDTSGAGRGRL
uniref:Uncharacterized protein n=1 Tax=Anguilla anguilla TaxID=7936 RepID=A0A0E9W209_ANGAN